MLLSKESSCGKTIQPGDIEASGIMLQKKANWQYPVWGNILEGTGGLAVAALCGDCAGKEPTNAIKKAGEKFELVPLSELEDYNEDEASTEN